MEPVHSLPLIMFAGVFLMLCSVVLLSSFETRCSTVLLAVTCDKESNVAVTWFESQTTQPPQWLVCVPVLTVVYKVVKYFATTIDVFCFTRSSLQGLH